MSFSRVIRQQVKRSMQHVAAGFGAHTRAHASPQLLVLMYHRILPPDDARIAIEEPGMTVSPDTFKKNLTLLAGYFEFIQLSDWLARKATGQPLPKKACAITFDDGWADNYEFAYPILRDAGVPATIFAVSDMLGTQKMFWPERLARILAKIATEHSQSWDAPCLEWLRSANTDFSYADIAPTREQISQFVAHAKHNTDQDNHLRLDRIERELGLDMHAQHTSLLTWQQLAEMVAGGLVEVGSHTCNHTRLNQQTPDDVARREILDSKQHIEAHIAQPVKTFCFPNGDYSQTALELVQQNYTGAVTTERGWNSAATDNYQLHRIGIHEDIARDKTAFLARISGWL